MSINRIKFLELRDRATFIPVIAIDMSLTGNSYNDYLLIRAGYSSRAILLTALVGGKKAECDPYAWGDRTYMAAHIWIEEHWDDISDAEVIDVEYILGESKTKKQSERHDDTGVTSDAT